MIIADIRDDFYNVLLGNRVLLLVHYDVDAICSCKILQGLFKCDNIPYTLVPVSGISELKTAYEENSEEIKYVVLINCGGTVDLVDILQPEEDVVFFVLDAHKPTHVCNVYSDGQIRLVYRDSEEDIPDYDAIFRDDEDEEEEEENIREGLEAIVERRRARAAWEQKRHTLMFSYTQFSYYGKPSALVLLSLAWRISRCGVACVWAAAVASAAQRALCSRALELCLLDETDLHAHVANRVADDDAGAKVALEKDVWLPLYRLWSVENAICHSPTLGPRLKLHTLAGASRVRQLLADMGFPLIQARQAYRSMDVELRHSLLDSLESALEKHKLPSAAEAMFLLQRVHCPALAAFDVVLAVLGLIEHESIPRAEGFQHALSALDISAGVNESLRIGVESAKTTLGGIARLVNSTLSARPLPRAGPFSYFIVQEGTPEAKYVRGAHWLGVLARWAATAGTGSRALVASAPIDDAHCILLGIPPKFATEPRNLFGAASEQAAQNSGAQVSLDSADACVLTMKTAHRATFLDALTALLA